MHNLVKNQIVLVYPYSEALWGGVGALRLFSWMAYLIISKLNFTENQAIHHPAIKTFHETKKEKGFADRPFQNPGIAKKGRVIHSNICGWFEFQYVKFTKSCGQERGYLPSQKDDWLIKWLVIKGVGRWVGGLILKGPAKTLPNKKSYKKLKLGGVSIPNYFRSGQLVQSPNFTLWFALP